MEFKRHNACFIIADAGVNHNGDINIAKKLIDVAVDSGVDAVKFQTFSAKNLVLQNAPKADYQKENTGNGNQYDMLKKLELSFDDHITLKRYCDEKGIIFLSTPFDFESIDLIEKLDVLAYKVSSSDLTNLPFLHRIAKKGKPIILSTGMANLGEIEDAINCIQNVGNVDLVLLQCTSSYPTCYEDVNLRAMLTLQKTFKLPTGFSDHTLGIEISLAAVAIGAQVIEKHFTLDKNMSGPDHKASLEPKELRKLVQGIRNIEKALGDGIKRCNQREINVKKNARKSIVAKAPIDKGDIITSENITIKRPEGGIRPKYFGKIIGYRAIEKIEADTFITWDMLSR